MSLVYLAGGVFLFLFSLFGIRIVRPTQRALIERFGKYLKYCEPGFHWVIPIVDRMVKVNITENMVDVESQEIITSDKLNANVDAQIYYKVMIDEISIKNSQYSVNNYEYQIVNLARTTLRNIIGTMTLKAINNERNAINSSLYDALSKEIKDWGLAIVRAELKEVVPPKSVQESMNKIVMAENDKIAASDFALATEMKAEGEMKAEIKKAEGIKKALILKAEGDKEAQILRADGEAQAIKMVNESAIQYFKGDAQELRKIQALETAFAKSTKIVIPSNGNFVNLIDTMINKQ